MIFAAFKRAKTAQMFSTANSSLHHSSKKTSATLRRNRTIGKSTQSNGGSCGPQASTKVHTLSYYEMGHIHFSIDQLFPFFLKHVSRQMIVA